MVFLQKHLDRFHWEYIHTVSILDLSVSRRYGWNCLPWMAEYSQLLAELWSQKEHYKPGRNKSTGLSHAIIDMMFIIIIMKLVQLQSRLLATAAEFSLESQNKYKIPSKFFHALGRFILRQKGRPYLSHDEYLETLHRFTEGAEEVATWWDYQVAIDELISHGSALKIMKTGYDSLLGLGNSSVEELVKFKDAMDLDESEDILQQISESELFLLLAKRLRMARGKEFAK